MDSTPGARAGSFPWLKLNRPKPTGPDLTHCANHRAGGETRLKAIIRFGNVLRRSVLVLGLAPAERIYNVSLPGPRRFWPSAAAVHSARLRARGPTPAAAPDPCPGSSAQVGSPRRSGVPGSRDCAETRSPALSSAKRRGEPARCGDPDRRLLCLRVLARGASATPALELDPALLSLPHRSPQPDAGLPVQRCPRAFSYTSVQTWPAGCRCVWAGREGLSLLTLARRASATAGKKLC
ncbi:hypothetical protein P7K49_024278 [Saguinus oedipus]|uniref:Uncharacterized protein n=1 Tax=Saguinus oedipus TaxID=9490 RepID=A0ABQ9URE7_SAGOE|nr:hypothetical protein P7K49_024278 [Saguinus oedipus]